MKKIEKNYRALVKSYRNRLDYYRRLIICDNDINDKLNHIGWLLLQVDIFLENYTFSYSLYDAARTRGILDKYFQKLDECFDFIEKRLGA